MKIKTTSAFVLAACGLVAAASLPAGACEFHKNHVTAAVNPPPVEETVAAPATTVDPMVLADAAKAVLVPVAPREESLEAVETD
jgi:hypothetical protein